MSTDIATILQSIEDDLVANITSVTEDRIYQGRYFPVTQANDTFVNLIPVNEPGEWTDGDDTKRTLDLIVIVGIRLDASIAAKQFKQIHDEYMPIHKRLENFTKNNLGGTVNRFEEDDSGIEWPVFEDKHGPIAAVGSGWSIEFERALGT